MSARTPISTTTPTATNITRLPTASAASSACRASTRICMRAKTAGRSRGYQPITTSPTMPRRWRSRSARRNGSIDNRALPDGGFRHGEKDRGGPFLGDTLAMGQAFLDLYAATGNRDWLTSAAKAGDFVATFRDEAGGFVTSKTSEGKTGVLRQTGKTDRRPGAGHQVHEPAQPLLRQRDLSRAGRACDALSRQRLGRDDASACPACCSPTKNSRSSRPI